MYESQRLESSISSVSLDPSTVKKNVSRESFYELIRFIKIVLEMTETLGNKIPDSCFSALSAKNSRRANDVIILLTVDETEFPRVCLLSSFQVLATNRSLIYFVVNPNSSTRQNLDRTGKATLIIPESTGLLYVGGEMLYLKELPEENSQALYSMKIILVSRDVSKTAPIDSKMTFDTSIIEPEYQKNFEQLRDFTQ